jgi:hypothetical protein
MHYEISSEFQKKKYFPHPTLVETNLNFLKPIQTDETVCV